MPKDKRTFFERLTGSVHVDHLEDELEESPKLKNKNGGGLEYTEEETTGEGQLPIDVFETDTDIVLKTMVAGVKPEDLDVSITRDMVTIHGKREGENTIEDENYFHRELYWGSFSRSIVLPAEIEVEESEAVEKHGLLIIKLPKINKNKQTKLRVKSS